MPCATEIVREMCGEEKAKALLKIPISNNTVKHRISSISKDIMVQCTASSAVRAQGVGERGK